jgi:hypothetical protein
MATIVTKNSSTASAVPTTSDLVQGELAVNVTDKRIFTENASTEIVELGTNPSSITTATATVTGTLTANGTFASSNAVITGGSINSTPIGASTPSTIVGSTITANTGFIGGLTGNVTGNVTGNLTGNVTGDLTGNVTGNVTASSGTTTLNNLVVNGTADFTNTKLTNVVTPTAGTDAANKSYVDDTVAAVIDSAPAALDTLNELAAALGDDADFAGTVTTALATKLPLAGGTMTGAIAMGTSKITGLGDPTSAQDAATKTYVDTADALKLNLTGGTMSGAIAMGTNKITGVGDPTLAQDVATKAYTDSILGSATSAADSAAAASASASAASTSASNASDSADAAAASAAAAASSYDAFDDRYLGDKASDPTLDNDGNALLTGALYFNTTSDVMKVYDGSAWNIAAISSASPTFTGDLTLESTDAGAGEGPEIFLHRNSASPAASDVLGVINFDGKNSAGSQHTYGKIKGVILDPTNTSEDGKLVFQARGAGAAFADILTVNSTGIDVTGTATMDGLTVDGDASFSGTSVSLILFETDQTDLNTRFRQTAGDIYIQTLVDDISSAKNRLSIDHATGDISFYEDTGTTPKFFWDASAESLGIGTSSPTAPITIAGAAQTGVSSSVSRVTVPNTVGNRGGHGVHIEGGGFLGGITAQAIAGGSYPSSIGRVDIVVQNGGSTTTAATFDASGNVGIGTSTIPTGVLLGRQLVASSSTGAEIIAFREDSSVDVGDIAGAFLIGNSDIDGVEDHFVGMWGKLSSTNGSQNLHFAAGRSGYEGDVPQMTLDSSGNLLVGTTDGTLYDNTTGSGFAVTSSGRIYNAVTSNSAQILNRMSTDGGIVDFRKDGTTVGSIGTKSSGMYIGTDDAGIFFNHHGGGDLDAIFPYDVGTNTFYNGHVNIGGASNRFKDAHFSGTVNANAFVGDGSGLTGVGGGGFSNMTTITGSTTWSIPSGVTAIKIYVTGGGGGAGLSYSCGGSAGGTAIKYLDVSGGGSITITIGSGGTSASAGNAGGTSTAVYGATTITGGGGAGGTSQYASGGSASGGDLNITGGAATGSGYQAETGAGSFWGTGSHQYSGPYGAGGGSYMAYGSPTNGYGRAGVVVIEY